MAGIDDIYDDQAIKPKSRGSIHKRLIDWFGEQPRGKVLDAPAGYGHLSLHLREMRFDVTCGEIQPEIFQVEGLACIRTDLNREIEAPDNSFDYVCCVDGLEHMTDPYRAVEEFARVLKPGGRGIFTIPNYSNIESRGKFFLRGYLVKPKTLAQYEADGGSLADFHNSPLTITLLDLIFAINALEIEDILRDKVKRKQACLWPVVAAMRLIAACSSAKSRARHRTDLTLRDEVILGGNTLIFVTRKKGKGELPTAKQD